MSGLDDRRWDTNPNRKPAVLLYNRPPMREPATARWDLDISAADFAELKLGFRPRQMEDRWAIAAATAEPDSNGVIFIYIMRSWTRRDCYILHVKPKGTDATNGTGGARIESITWEQVLDESATVRHSENAAKSNAAFLCRIVGGCALEKLPPDEATIGEGGDGDDKAEEGKDRDAQSRDVEEASS